MTMIRACIVGVLVTLSATLAGCGSNGPKTSLLIQLGESGIANGGVKAYRLRCDPAGGTAPHPKQICRALARHSNLLVGGPGFDHSCPSSGGTKVAGLYRGRSVDAFFGVCAWIPGQGNGLEEWQRLLQDASKTAPTTVDFRSIPAPKARGDLSRRRRLNRVAKRLQADIALLTRRREAALAAGSLRLVRGKPDAMALHILRDLALGTGLPDGPRPVEVRVYSNRRRYLLVLRFDYVDYRGVERRAPGGMTFSMPVKSLRTSTWSVGDTLPSPAGLGPGTKLPL